MKRRHFLSSHRCNHVSKTASRPPDVVVPSSDVRIIVAAASTKHKHGKKKMSALLYYLIISLTAISFCMGTIQWISRNTIVVAEQKKRPPPPPSTTSAQRLDTKLWKKFKTVLMHNTPSEMDPRERVPGELVRIESHVEDGMELYKILHFKASDGTGLETQLKVPTFIEG